MKPYNPHEIEPRWQKAWADADLYKVTEDPSKPKRYVLEMFPYPSGDIHMGHVRNYTIGDVVARYYKMRGFDVLHPMGWDAFGLPAENAAIKRNSHPAKWTYANIDTQKASFKRMGFSYDWDRTVVACDPEYYRWGQWIFLKFWERGLVERRNSPVNWCPSCKTVLANEQVIEGRCWRCDSEVEKRDLTQWYLKITDYAQELLDDLDQLDGWPERVKQQQANWIGRSEGANVDFILCDRDGNAPENPTEDDIITVFTTRPDTLFGCSFFLLAPESKLLHGLVEGTEYEAPVMELVEAAKKVTAVQRAQGDHEKHGAFTGRYVVNPINGEKVPVWVGDYIVADYGTGAVMAVPCGDQRDFEFARKYDLPIIPIILGEDDPLFPELDGVQERRVTSVDWDHAYDAEGVLVQSGKYTGMTGGKHSPAVDAIIAEGTESGGHVGEMTTMALVPQVIDAVSVPVVAAGGIADGRQAAAAFALGACGIQVGTCLLASEECPIHPNYKQAVLKAKDSDTVVTGRSIGGPVRILKNKMAREYLALEKRGASLEELEKVTLGGLRRAVLEGDVEMGSVMSGQVAGMLHEIRPVAEIFRDLYESGIARAKATAAEWSDAE